MEQKKRLVIVAAIVLLMAAAMLASFGRVLFAADTPKVILPSSSAGPGDVSGTGGVEQDYQRVEVTTQTVTGVVATLARPASYYRELTAETFWDGGSSAVQVQVWTDGGWSHSRQTLPSGVVRHDLTGDGTLYYWPSAPPPTRRCWSWTRRTSPPPAMRPGASCPASLWRSKAPDSSVASGSAWKTACWSPPRRRRTGS